MGLVYCRDGPKGFNEVNNHLQKKVAKNQNSKTGLPQFDHWRSPVLLKRLYNRSIELIILLILSP